MATQPAAGLVTAPDARDALDAQPSISHASQHPQEAPAPQQAAAPKKSKKKYPVYPVVQALGSHVVEVWSRPCCCAAEEAQQDRAGWYYKPRGAAGLQLLSPLLSPLAGS